MFKNVFNHAKKKRFFSRKTFLNVFYHGQNEKLGRKYTFSANSTIVKKMPMDLGRDRKKRTLIESRRKSVPAIHQIDLPLNAADLI